MTASTAVTARSGSKLSDTALVILGAAAQRQDRLLLPVPTSIDASPEVIGKTIKSLLSKSMIEERPAKLEDVVWRKDEQEQNFTLSITDTGIAVLDGDLDEVSQADAVKHLANDQSKSRTGSGRKAAVSKRKKPTTKTSKNRSKGTAAQESKDRKGTKADLVVALLARSNGTTLAEMMKATGWQAHSVRGFLSGTVKNRMGFKVISERLEGKDRRYWTKS